MTASNQRMYEPHWKALKKSLLIKVDLSSSEVPEVLKRLKATLTKAIQKEKFNDVNFRANYPNAKLSTESVENNQSVMVKLELGLSTNDDNMKKLFGGSV